MGVRREVTIHEQLRRRAGYSVTELARSLGVSHAYVSQIEGGTVTPSVRYREAFQELLGVSAELAFPGMTEVVRNER